MIDHTSPRWVLHIDMDAFYASCEQLTRPTLKGRPVLVAGVSGRGVVAGASYEARAFGAHSAMPTHRAARLIGYSAVLVAPRRIIYTTASRRVFQVIEEHVGLVEKLSIDEGFMEPAELAGAKASEVHAWAEQLRSAIREETGLPASIGAGAGKQYAKISSGLAKPDGVFVMPPQEHQALLNPLNVNKLWGVGPVTESKLHQLGVETIGDLAELNEKDVRILLGDTIGPSLHQLARGMDERPVAPRAIAKSVGAEHTYPQDLLARADVDAALERSFKDAHRRLRRDGRGARTVSVKLRMSDFHIESRSFTLPYATDDPETLKATAFRLLRYPDEVGPIRLVGVSFSGLESARQDVLFPELDQLAQPPAPSDNDYEVGVSDGTLIDRVDREESRIFGPKPRWTATQDVHHPEHGHGWVQGAGRGVVTIRFETRTTGPGRARTFPADDPALREADPLDSLDWDEWLAQN